MKGWILGGIDGILVAKNELVADGREDFHEIKEEYRGTQREYSSKPLKHSVVKRILVF